MNADTSQKLHVSFSLVTLDFRQFIEWPHTKYHLATHSASVQGRFGILPHLSLVRPQRSNVIFYSVVSELLNKHTGILKRGSRSKRCGWCLEIDGYNQQISKPSSTA